MKQQPLTVSTFLKDGLRHPATGVRLHVDSDGGFVCDPDSTAKWPIQNGIPRFVDDQHLKSFGDQWTTYEVAHDDEDKATFAAKTGIRLEQLEGQKVLDAGCGGGRYSRICGEAGATVIGADHSRAVDKAISLCSHLPDVGFLQADLKHLPLEKESFDFVFSIGVMHHDVNTRAVFDSVAKLVRPGGRYSVWLYRRNQWWQEAINTGLRAITTRTPAAALKPFCHTGAILGGIPVVNRTLNKIVNFSAHPSYENRVCDTFDWWAPKHQHHHTVDELSSWFHEAGFDALRVLPPEKTGGLYQRAYDWNLLIGSGVNITGVRSE